MDTRRFPYLVLALVLSPAFATAAPSAVAKAYYDEGRQLVEEGRSQEASEAFGQAVAADPGFTEAWVDLGAAQIELGKFEDAKRSYQTALELDDQRHVARYNLAYVERRLGNHRAAAEQYQRYLKTYPNSADAYYGLAESLRGAGDKAGAADAYDRYADNEKRPEQKSWVDKARQLAQSLRAEAQPAPAPAAPSPPPVAQPAPAPTTPKPAATASKSTSAPPERAPADLAPVLELLKKNKYEAALERLTEWRGPRDDRFVLAALGSAHLGLGEGEEAEGAYRAAIRAGTTPPPDALQFGLAEALRIQEKDDEARALFEGLRETEDQGFRRLAEARLRELGADKPPK